MPSKVAARTIFTNAAVFDGTTPYLLEDQSVVVEDGRIVEVKAGVPSVSADQVVNVRGRTLMPGLIDLHTHACLTDAVAPRAVLARTELVALHAAKALNGSLMSGFTTLRDAGGLDSVYLEAIELGLIEGPRIYHSGRFISMTGGHGDMRDPNAPPNSTKTCCGTVLDRFISIADGPDEVRKAVREELRRGAKQIKLFISGGVLSPTGRIDDLQYTDEEIRVAVQETAYQNKYVMAHCHPDNGIRRAVELGVRSIEHCTFVSQETAKFMKEEGAYAVPTLAVINALTKGGASIGLPPANRAKAAGALEKALKGFEILTREGVKIGFGSDVSGQFQNRQCSEFSLRAEIAPAYNILVSATSMAAEILREDGNLGIVRPGAHADLLVVDGNPLDDIRILDRPTSSIAVIMKGGHFHKNAA